MFVGLFIGVWIGMIVVSGYDVVLVIIVWVVWCDGWFVFIGECILVLYGYVVDLFVVFVVVDGLIVLYVVVVDVFGVIVILLFLFDIICLVVMFWLVGFFVELLIVGMFDDMEWVFDVVWVLLVVEMLGGVEVCFDLVV